VNVSQEIEIIYSKASDLP